MNVLLIPVLTVAFAAGGFYAYTNAKFIQYDMAAADVIAMKMHNAAQDEKVTEITASLDKIMVQLDLLRRNAPVSGPGSGGGSAVGGGLTTRH